MAARQIRIALVEDSKTMRFFYKTSMERLGFEVVTAENGRQGWQVITQEKPDVILLDMILPDVSGLTLLKKIRSVEETKRIPVIALTSIKDIQQVQQVLQSGANHYSVKGNDSTEKLAQMIYKLLKKFGDGGPAAPEAKKSADDEADAGKKELTEDDIDFIR
ncbi:response regulator [bacterium]|nr:response regulator [bacterium]